jgi:hypothetical protein
MSYENQIGDYNSVYADKSNYSGGPAEYANLKTYNSFDDRYVSSPYRSSNDPNIPVVIVPSYGGAGYNVLQNGLRGHELNPSGYFINRQLCLLGQFFPKI